MVLPRLVRANIHNTELQQFKGFIYANIHLRYSFFVINELVYIMNNNKINGYINGT
jgi:hypothetical protein